MEDQNTDERWLVPVSAILDICNPMTQDVWDCGVITQEDVDSCLDNSMGSLPYELTPCDSSSKEYNIARISWLIDNYDWSDNSDREPISMDLMEGETWHPIIDGNHRVAAAACGGVQAVVVSISGDLDYAEEVLGYHPQMSLFGV